MQLKDSKRLAYVGCLGMIGIISTEFGIIGVLPQVAEHYHLTIDQAGYLLSAFALVIALTGPFMMLYTSSMDGKKIMIIATSLFLISNVISFFQPPFGLLMVLRVLPAFLQPVFISLAMAAAGRDVDAQTQIRHTGIIVGGIPLAQVTTIPLATYIASSLGWNVAYLVQAVINALVLCLLFYVMPPNPVKKEASILQQIGILKKTSFLWSIVFNFFFIGAWFSSYSYFANFLQSIYKFSKSETGFLLLLFGIMGTVGNAFASRWLTKNMLRTTLIVSLGTLIFPVFTSLGPVNKIYGIFSVIVWGLLYGPCFITAITFMQSAATEAKSFSNTLQTSFANLGISAGTFISGITIAHYGMITSPWVGAGFGVIAIASLSIRVFADKKLYQKRSANSVKDQYKAVINLK